MRLRKVARAFVDGKRGSIPLLTAFLIVPMTILAGGAVDLVRFEQVRSRLQDSLDRGVLAAASLTQANPARQTVENYLKTVGADQPIQLDVSETKQVNLRRVTATATIEYPTSFLQLAGIDTLSIPASSTAEERRQNVELSLVLDISGSMYDNGGIFQLRPAAKDFIDAILKKDVQPVTSVSIVPFAGQVNLGNKVFDYLTSSGIPGGGPYVRRHAYSSCFELLDANFGAGVPIFPALDQTPHFTYYNYNAKGKKPWWCPTDDAAISYLSNDPAYLKGKIDALEPFDGTGTAYGMKWAELLLNPSMRSNITAIQQKGLAPIPPAFVGRPADFGDPDTLKFIVLMTDGQIGFQPRPKDITTNAVTDKNISCSNCSREIFKGQVEGQYKRICDYAKSKGITVFTIAFKISNNDVAKSLAACASNPSYAYRVDGLDITKAFQSIATSIQKIRLVS